MRIERGCPDHGSARTAEAALRERQLMAARHQALFREVNERIDLLQTTWHTETQIEFICECFDNSCSAALVASHAEYLVVRSDARRFLVLAGHADPEIERVVATNPRYWTVEKLEAAVPFVVNTDPRRRRVAGIDSASDPNAHAGMDHAVGVLPSASGEG